MSNTIETRKEDLATTIPLLWTTWDDARAKVKEEWQELRNYLYATDTTKTTNSKLPWSNKTTMPKLTQIMENLLANYEASLFPNEDWLVWEAQDFNSALKEKKRLVTEYTKAKLKEGSFRKTMSTALLDWVITGNAFASCEFERKIRKGSEGEEDVIFSGGKAVRVSPQDIVFNPTAKSFEESPKIIRYIKTMGDLSLDLQNKPELKYDSKIVKDMMDTRANFAYLSKKDQDHIRKSFSIDGFGSIDDYYQEGVVELLEFTGNIYDNTTGELLEGYVATIADRQHILRLEKIDTWNGEEYIKHVGWRPRPDNLWAMSPLANLVGMQYRIDHLENLKADIMDLVAYPIPILKGDVEWDGWYPGSQAILGEDGAIDTLKVDSAALNYDNQISLLEAKMEQYAGAPREAMGIRSPGEKTAYEVQQLQNAASRLFQSKIEYFEEAFLEPLVNQIFEISRRNLEGTDLVRLINEEFGAAEFLTITREDLKSKGAFYPRGARHFAERARFVQEVTNFMQTMPPDVTNHISGKVVAKAFAEHTNLDSLGAYKPNIRIEEQVESQRVAQTGQNILEEEALASTENIGTIPE